MPEDSKIPMMSFYCSRKRVDVEHLTADDIDIDDVFHNLCIAPRFAGNTSRPYTVAEHSLLVFQMVEKHFRDVNVCLQALLHDAPEYITGDIPAPVKHAVPEIRDFEKKVIWPVMCEKFQIDEAMHKAVMDADWVALFVEAHSLGCSDELDQWENYDRYWPIAEKWMEAYGGIDPRTQPHPGMINEVLHDVYQNLIEARIEQARVAV